jgi:hypothetical protein
MRNPHENLSYSNEIVKYFYTVCPFKRSDTKENPNVPISVRNPDEIDIDDLDENDDNSDDNSDGDAENTPSEQQNADVEPKSTVST